MVIGYTYLDEVNEDTKIEDLFHHGLKLEDVLSKFDLGGFNPKVSRIIQDNYIYYFFRNVSFV
jgi:hypothetical protein